jgi:phenylacetate-coenzyme A ligase PaaK-like adenylate-forming protein
MSSILLKEQQQAILVEKLNQLLPYMVENFDYYSKSLLNMDLQISSIEDLTRFPLVDKKEMPTWDLASEALANNPPAYFETSGTSGLPFPVLPDLSSKRMQEFGEFITKWLGHGSSTKITRAIIALPFEMNPIGLKYFLALNHLNITAIPVGVRTHLCPPRKVIDIIDRLKPELLIARPMETLRYAEAMLELGIDPAKSSIKKIILTGEIISRAKFKRISKLFGGADVYSVYGLTEVDSGGMVSCQNHHYHLPENPYLVIELLADDFKTPVKKEGDMGHIVLTNTHQNYMPLFRYKTGDYGVLNLNCKCGQFHTPVINLLGRASDRININGSSVFPIEIEEIIFQYDELASEYQLVMHGDRLILRIESTKQAPKNSIEQLAFKIKLQIQNKFNIDIDIQILGPSGLSHKLGIAKSKAGTLYSFPKTLATQEMNKSLEVNFSCNESL